MKIIKTKLAKAIIDYPETKQMYFSLESVFNIILTKHAKLHRRINCILIHDKDEIVGWAWLMRRRANEWDRIKSEFVNKSYIDYMCYVKPNFRKKGYGTKLLEAASSDLKRSKKMIKVYPHNEVANSFYSKTNNLITSKKESWWKGL